MGVILKIVTEWVDVAYECPYCDNDIEVDIKSFLIEQCDRFFSDWKQTWCPVCNNLVEISDYEID